MVEGIRRPNEFMAVAEQALNKGKPILAVKLGRSEMGRRQAISHTGSLAGADEVFDAVCHRLGLIRCPTLEDMTEMTLAFMPGTFSQGQSRRHRGEFRRHEGADLRPCRRIEN